VILARVRARVVGAKLALIVQLILISTVSGESGHLLSTMNSLVP